MNYDFVFSYFHLDSAAVHNICSYSAQFYRTDLYSDSSINLAKQYVQSRSSLLTCSRSTRFARSLAEVEKIFEQVKAVSFFLSRPGWQGMLNSMATMRTWVKGIR